MLLGLNQTEMCQDVISESFYSKVERGKSEINASDLIQILNLHHVSLYDFFETFDHSSENSKIDENQLIAAFKERDLQQLKKFADNKKQLNKKCTMELEIILAFFENDLAKVSKETRRKIKKEIAKIDEWNAKSVWNLIFAMPLYQTENLAFFMDELFAKFEQKNDVSDEMLDALANAALFYLEICYRKNEIVEGKKAIKFISGLENTIQLLMPKLMGQYYLARLKKDQITAAKIGHLLKMSGYERYLNCTD